MKYLALTADNYDLLVLTPNNDVIYINTSGYVWRENPQETKHLKPLGKKEWEWALKNWGKTPFEIEEGQIKKVEAAIMARKLYFSNIFGKTFSIGGTTEPDSPFAKLQGLIK